MSFIMSKIAFGWDSAPDPARGAHDTPPDTLIGLAQALHVLAISGASRNHHTGHFAPSNLTNTAPPKKIVTAAPP